MPNIKIIIEEFSSSLFKQDSKIGPFSLILYFSEVCELFFFIRNFTHLMLEFIG